MKLRFNGLSALAGLAVGVFIAAAISGCGGIDTSASLAEADGYLKEISAVIQQRNIDSAPLASKAGAALSGELSTSEFVATYPQLVEQSQQHDQELQALCAAPPETIADSGSSEERAAAALVAMGQAFCEAEPARKAYILAFINAAAVQSESALNDMQARLGEYTSRVKAALDGFLSNPDVIQNVSFETRDALSKMSRTFAN